MEDLQSLLSELSAVSIFVRLALALLMGAVLGTERGLRNHPAGFMTYALVCLGSAVVMLTDQFVVASFPGADPNRMAAQVVSGIGFLGAGTIIVTHNDEVRGLTTAAGIWLAAGLGLAVGAGFYAGAFLGFLFALFTLYFLKKLDLYIKRHARSMEIYLEYNEAFSIRRLSELAREHSFELIGLQRGRVKALHEEVGVLTFSVNFPRQINHDAVLNSLYEMEGVEYVRELA